MSLNAIHAKQHRPIPTDETWKLLHDAYQKVMDGAEAPKSGETGFMIPISMRYCTQGKGRGIFAAQAISKNTVVMRNTPTAYFYEAEKWKSFLKHLPNDLACDVVVWAYVLSSEPGDEDHPYDYVGLDLGPGSLMNHGGTVDADEGTLLETIVEQNNLVYATDGSWDLLAVKDIKEGEELLCDYGSFHNYQHELDWFTESETEYTFDTKK